MKKVLVLATIAAAFLMVGCGSGAEGNDVAAAGKNSMAPAPAPIKAGGKSNGMANDTATPAPTGVKTGTPGG